MAFYFSKALKVFAETASFVVARLIASAYFAMFSVLIAVFFVFVPVFFNLDEMFFQAFLALGLIVFLVYWHFFRKKILFVLKSSETVVVSEFLSGRNVPVTTQASFGFNLIKKRFSSLGSFSETKKKTEKAISRFYGIIGFVGLIPNVTSAVFYSVVSYVFADPSVDINTSLRDALVLFYQKKNFILFQIFAMQVFSYTVFVVSFVVAWFLLNPFISGLEMHFALIAFSVIFLLLLVAYTSFVSHFLVCWQIVFFIETIKNDVPSKNTRSVLENLSADFNEFSSKAKIFVPLKSLSSRKLASALDVSRKAESVLSSVSKMIKDKKELEEESKGEEALDDLVKKINEVKSAPDKKKLMKKLEEEKRKLAEKYGAEREYNKVFNLLLDFLGDQLGTRNKFEIASLKKEESNWHAVVIINIESFDFILDSEGNVTDFKERK